MAYSIEQILYDTHELFTKMQLGLRVILLLQAGLKQRLVLQYDASILLCSKQ